MTSYTEEGVGQKSEQDLKTSPEQKIEITGKEKEDKKSKAKKAMKEKDYYIYKLVGVVVHNGNAEAGHYFSFINTQRNEWEESEDYLKTEKDRWVEFNDSIVREFNFQKLESECFGGSQEDCGDYDMENVGEYTKFIDGRSKSAYLLIYERKKKFLIPAKLTDFQLLDSDILVSSLECESTAVSRADKEKARIIFKDSHNEHYVLQKFHHIPLVIPKSVDIVK